MCMYFVMRMFGMIESEFKNIKFVLFLFFYDLDKSFIFCNCDFCVCCKNGKKIWYFIIVLW